MRLSSKISLVMASTSIIALVGGGYVTYRVLSGMTQQFAVAGQIHAARQAMGHVDRLLYERLLDVQAIVGEEVFIGALTGAPQGRLNAVQRLNELAVVTGPWDELTIADVHGVAVASTNERAIGATLLDEPNQRAACEAAIRGDLYYSDRVVAGNGGRSTILFAAPIRDRRQPKHPIQGVVVGAFAWRSIMETLEAVTGHAVLLDRRGIVIGLQMDVTGTDLAGRLLRDGELVQALSAGRPVSKVIGSQDGFLPVQALASLAPQEGYLSYRGSGWGVLLEVPAEAVLLSARRMAVRLMLFFVPLVMLTASLLFWMLQQIVRPIASLTQVAEAITNGDLTRQAPVTSRDEIGRLAVSFNMMTAVLRDLHKSLEDKIRERTLELSRVNADLQAEQTRLERLNRVMMNREERILELKQEVNGVLGELGKSDKYHA